MIRIAYIFANSVDSNGIDVVRLCTFQPADFLRPFAAKIQVLPYILEAYSQTKSDLLANGQCSKPRSLLGVPHKTIPSCEPRARKTIPITTLAGC
jgi:hypothetical protein